MVVSLNGKMHDVGFVLNIRGRMRPASVVASHHV